ncbi:uncharacterized protein [Watersipora subatra]|uniref:uncharacterized protein n=1 Tax=Watersipora subatra TaxID=2589382 RepID=UPI00355B926C
MGEAMSDKTIELVEFLQNELVIANDRAMRAEKKLLELQIESFIGNLRDSQKAIEDSFVKKRKAYDGATGDLSKNEREFKERTAEIEQDINAKEEIYDLYRRALDTGLHLDDLPHLTIDKTTYEVHLLLQQKLGEKKEKDNKKDDAWSALRNLFISAGGDENTDHGEVTNSEAVNGHCNDRPLHTRHHDGDAYDPKLALHTPDPGQKHKKSAKEDTMSSYQKPASSKSAEVKTKSEEIKTKPPEKLMHEVSKSMKVPEQINYISVNEKEDKSENEKGALQKEPLDWTKGHLLAVVKQLKSNHKQLSLKLAQETLEKSAQEIGSITDLDVVYKHAEAKVAMIFKPESKEPIKRENPVKALTLGQLTPTQNTKRPCEFYARGYCGFGPSCRFAHDGNSPRVNHNGSNVQHQQGNTGQSKTRMCHFYLTNKWCAFKDSCKFAHAIDEIAKGNTTNGDQYDHPEPCDDQECRKKLRYLLTKTSLCPQVAEGKPCTRAMRGCTYAHSPQEILDMPKWELCDRAMSSCCKHQRDPSKCVYAHSKAELKPRPTLREASPLPAQVTTCAICQHPLQVGDKTLLTCGHDAFHRQCINDWMQSLAQPYCPICVRQ